MEPDNPAVQRVRQIATGAAPEAAQLIAAQRTLLRSASTKISPKGMSCIEESSRRLGILIPPWKYPVLFEETVLALGAFWTEHSGKTTLGRTRLYIRERQHATKFIRALASNARGKIEPGTGSRAAHAADGFTCDVLERNLASTAVVQMFRLINGNLEIPPTIFKALMLAGRIDDAFFPDEPDTWRHFHRGLVDANLAGTASSGDSGICNRPTRATRSPSGSHGTDERPAASRSSSELLQTVQQQLQDQLQKMPQFQQADSKGDTTPMPLLPIFITMPGNSRSGSIRSSQSSGSGRSRDNRAAKRTGSPILGRQSKVMRLFLESLE
ncbi:hypothetical protein F503_00808 [Ophiostoma piceae UAMH 11346]|uniref:Uncharacterized protein n=1 Tax=Ophiostoma piceae (strain UAMH 11346) TaxID=1262450 RepID=S3D3T4_OPHP1|nr:hypothetical protein F503_00808 [Ophiostoma piceae UAMH 11346]